MIYTLKKQISVVGCGWLGLPLAKKLNTEGYRIKGSTTSEDKLIALRKASVEGFIVKLNEDGISGNYYNFLTESDIVIINIPPGLRKNPSKNHIAELKHLMAAIETQEVKNVIYISSTSVFENDYDFPNIDENTKPNATSNSAKQLIEIERLLQENINFNSTILRFGGLFDSEKHPAKYLSGRKNISNPNAPINLIHKQDCIAIISLLIKHDLWNMTLNAAYPHHPSKQTYYTDYCKRNKIALPTFNLNEKSKGKIVDSYRLVQLLNYSFKQAP